jgi:hypothetical protein
MIGKEKEMLDTCLSWTCDFIITTAAVASRIQVGLHRIFMLCQISIAPYKFSFEFVGICTSQRTSFAEYNTETTS